MFRVLCILLVLVVGERGAAAFDTTQAAALLTEARYARPEGFARLWNADDGLPSPNDASFPAAAARFLSEHPEPSPATLRNEAWTWDRVGSRQCKLLAWLADGKSPERKAVAELAIRQASRMVWALPASFGQRPQIDRSFYAATSSLALTAQIFHRAAPAGSSTRDMALQWALVGRGQLATHTAKGRESLAAAAREIVEAVPIDPALLTLRTDVEGFFAQLDLDRPDMAEVARAVRGHDFAVAEKAYVSALVRRFSRDQGWPDVDVTAGDANPAQADDVCRNVFILQAHMYRRYDYGAEVDWSLVIDNDIESRVWMNGHPWMSILLQAYRAKGDEKYVVHLCRLLNSWYQQSPPTFTLSTAASKKGQWRTLETGSRTGQRWPTSLLTLADNPTFQREGLFTMARSMLDHGRYMTMYSAAGGNWLQVESSGLVCVAALFPEFRLSPLFYDVAMARLARVNAGAFLPDGFQAECTPAYHRFPLKGMAAAVQLARYRRLPVTSTLLAQYEAAVAALGQIAYPDRAIPMLSDAAPQRLTIDDVMRVGATMFDRADFRWFATAGREGRPPEELSHDFTHAGYCVMRDRWGADGQMLIFDAGFFGTGHQHEDKLNFVLYGGGRELVGDPGIYAYKRNEMELYWRGTWSHNTVTVDDLSQHRALAPREPIPDPDRRFVRGDGFDYAVGWFRGPWSPRGSSVWKDPPQKRVSNRQASTRAFQQQRSIFYRKGHYAVVADRVLGEGQHQVDLHFQLAPIVSTDPAKLTARPVALDVRPDGILVTRENEHANVALLPAEPSGAKVLDLVGQKKPVRGWYAMYGIQPSHQIVYRRDTTLPVQFETVVQPLPPGQATPMRVERRELSAITPADAACAAVACGRDLLLVSHTGPAQMTCGPVHFEGTAALVVCDDHGKPTTAMLVDGRRLEFAGRRVYDVENPRAAATVPLR